MSQTYDFFENYFEYASITEPPKLFHRWAALGMLGAFMGRNIALPFGHDNVYPNQFILLVGDPGTRKSTAIGIAKGLAKDANYKTFAYSDTSGAKFLQDFHEGFNIDGKPPADDPLHSPLFEDSGSYELADPSECWVATGEFNTFIGHGNVEFLASLTDLWDNLPYKDVRTKTSSSFRIVKPTLSILGGNTQTGIAQAMPADVVGQGLLSRFILVYADMPTQKIAFPEQPNMALKGKLVQHLVRIRNLCGESKFDPAAKELATYIYETEAPLDDARFQYYHSRRFTHLLKLCQILAASRLSLTIEAPDVLYANSILSYTEIEMPKALGEFGKSKNSEAMQHVLRFFETANGSQDLNDVFIACSSELDDIKHCGTVVQNLIAAKKIELKPKANGKAGWVAVKKRRRKMEGAVDYTLLSEYVPPSNVNNQILLRKEA